MKGKRQLLFVEKGKALVSTPFRCARCLGRRCRLEDGIPCRNLRSLREFREFVLRVCYLGSFVVHGRRLRHGGEEIAAEF